MVSSIRANPWGALDPPWLRLFLALLLKQPHHSLPLRLSPVALMGIDGADPTALSPSTNCPVLVELRPRLRCPGCIIGWVKREPGWVSSECFSLRRFVLRFPRCLGCPRNGKQVWTRQQCHFLYMAKSLWILQFMGRRYVKSCEPGYRP